MTGRSTVSVVRQGPPRTARATEATKRKRVRRLLLELGARLDLVDDDWLATFACLVVNEIDSRDLRRLFHEKWEEINGE